MNLVAIINIIVALLNEFDPGNAFIAMLSKLLPKLAADYNSATHGTAWEVTVPGDDANVPGEFYAGWRPTPPA